MRDVSKVPVLERRNMVKPGDVVTVQLFNCRTFATNEKTVTISRLGYRYFYDENHKPYYWDELKEIPNA